jgi:hypothetical protein
MPKGAFVACVAILCLAGQPSMCLGEEQPNLREFGMRLARSAVPAGIVASDRALRQLGGGPAVASQATEEAAFKRDLTSQLARFNAARGLFRATRTDGIVRIRAAEEPADVMTALERRTYDAVVDVPALAAVLHHVTWAMSGSQPTGIMGVGAEPEPDCPMQTPVRIPAATSAIEALDQIVRQVPGLVWVVTYDSESQGRPMRVGQTGAASGDVFRRTLTVGLMCADGYIGTGTVRP